MGNTPYTYNVDTLNYQIQRIIPMVYDNSLSIYELVNAVVSKLNEVITDTNAYFDQDLETYVDNQLTSWKNDGTLSSLINTDILGSVQTEQATHQATLNDDNLIINLHSLNKGFRGLCVRSWETGTLNTTYFMDDLISKAKSLNVDTICVITNIYQTSATSNDIGERTPISTSDIDAYFSYLRSKGLKIIFKPHVEIDQTPYVWRGSINPTDSATWFTNYTNLMNSYAAICQKYNVEVFCIGSEYKTLTSTYPDKWVTLIESIRAIYTGALTYGANDSTDNGGDEANSITFWDKLDYIGVDFYVVPDTTSTLTTDQMVQAFYMNANHYNNVMNIDRLANKYGKPVLFTEFGIDNSTSTAYQQNYIDAVLQLYGNMESVHGTFLWVYDPSDSGSNASYRPPTVESVVTTHYGNRAKGKLPLMKLYDTYANSSGGDQWVKIATAQTNYAWNSSSLTLYVEQMQGNTTSEGKGRLYLRVGSDGTLNNYVECSLESGSTMNSADIGYVKNTGNVDFYVRVPNGTHIVYEKLRSNGVDTFTIYDRPTLGAQPANFVAGVAHNGVTYPQGSGVFIQTGTVTGSMVNGVINTTITLPENVTSVLYSSANCSDVGGGNAYDVTTQTKFMGNNQLAIYGRHDSGAGGYGYTVEYMAVCQ